MVTTEVFLCQGGFEWCPAPLLITHFIPQLPHNHWTGVHNLKPCSPLFLQFSFYNVLHQSPVYKKSSSGTQIWKKVPYCPTIKLLSQNLNLSDLIPSSHARFCWNPSYKLIILLPTKTPALKPILSSPPLNFKHLVETNKNKAAILPRQTAHRLIPVSAEGLKITRL